MTHDPAVHEYNQTGRHFFWQIFRFRPAVVAAIPFFHAAFTDAKPGFCGYGSGTGTGFHRTGKGVSRYG